MPFNKPPKKTGFDSAQSAMRVERSRNQGRSFVELEANPNCIKVQTTVAGDEVQITISDNGLGMSPEVRSQIFDHLHTTKTVGKGTGLGLAIAQQIIEEKHGGTTEVNSELGKGSTFMIQIPVLHHD